MIEGERVILRAIERKDLPTYVQWMNDPQVMEYFGRYLPLSLAQEEEWYEKQLRDSSVCNFAIEFQGEHVGGAGLFDIDGHIRSAEVGLFLGDPRLWDQGLGRDALQVLMRFGFEQLNLHRLHLRVFAENARAIHLYERLGFQHEGCWRQAEFRHGRYHDILWVSILCHEWKSDTSSRS